MSARPYQAAVLRRRRWLIALTFATALGGTGLATVWYVPPLRHAAGRLARRLHLRPADQRAASVPPVSADRVDAGTLAVDTLAGRLRRRDWPGAAAANAALAQEAFARADRTVRAWLDHRAPGLGLLPRRQRPGTRDYVWNYRDCAADLYSHLVIAAHLLGPDLVPVLRTMLATERSFDAGLPRGVDLASGEALDEDAGERLFGAVEYAKDGLLPIAERIGAPEWGERLTEVVARVLERSTVASTFGPLPSAGAEKNGEMLQVLARLYQGSRRADYLDAGRRIVDAYCREVLPGNGGLPAQLWDFDRHRAVTPVCRLRDHGNEAISGLVEWIAAELVAPASRAESYRPAVERMLSVLLERGRRPDGLWLSYVEPMAGAREHAIDGGAPNDNWGYVSSAFAAYALTLPADHPLRERFLAAARQSLRAAATLRSARWEWGHPDGYADALEGALYLLELLDDPEAQLWVDREIGVMFAFQHGDGFVDRTYLDGNFVRTALLYGLSRTAGVLPVPWRPTLHLGAQRAPDGLYLHVESTAAWQGALRFDTPRHRELMGLATRYPRLNAWPEWFVAEPTTRYEVTDLDSGLTRTAGGAELRAGWPLAFPASGAVRLRVRQVP